MRELEEIQLRSEIISANKIALLIRSAIGDFLLAIPAIKLIKKCNPSAKIYLFCDETVATIAGHTDLFSKIICIVNGWNKYFSLLITTLKFRKKFDAFVALKAGAGRQNSLAAFGLKAKYSFSYFHNYHQSYMTDRYISHKLFLSQEELQKVHYSRLCMNMVTNKKIPYLPPHEYFPKLINIDSPSENGIYIVIPITSAEDRRKPNIKFYSVLIKEIIKKLPQINIILSCLPIDKHYASQLTTVDPSRVLLKATPNFENFLSLIYGAKLVLGGDGGAMHIAAAMQIPTYIYLSEYSDLVWSPLSEVSKKTRFKFSFDELEQDQIILETVEYISSNQQINT